MQRAVYGTQGQQQQSFDIPLTPDATPVPYGAVNNKTSLDAAPLSADTVKSHSFNAGLWASYIGLTLFVYFAFSAGDFSFTMTAGALARMFGLVILNIMMFGQNSARGISVKTIQCYSVVFLARLSSIVRHDGYLPYDKSGDWIYHMIEILSLGLCFVAIYGCQVKFSKSYQADVDIFGAHPPTVPSEYGIVFLVGPMFVLALLIHPNLNGDFFSDFAWVFAMYLEAVAIIPQLYMFQKDKASEVELMNAHYVFALGLGRVLELVFWLFSYHELVSTTGSKAPGIVSVLAQIAQLALMADFFFYYFVAVKSGDGKMILPSGSFNDGGV